MEMDNRYIHVYNDIHNEVMRRLQNEEITVEKAKQLSDLAFNRFIVESDELGDVISSTATKGKELIQNILIDQTGKYFEKLQKTITDDVECIEKRIKDFCADQKFRDKLKHYKAVLDKAEEKDLYTFRYMDIEMIAENYAKEAKEYEELLKKIDSLKEIKKDDDSIADIPKKIENIYDKYEDKNLYILDSKQIFTINKAKNIYEEFDKLPNNQTVKAYIKELNKLKTTIDKIDHVVDEALNYAVKLDRTDDNGISANITHIKKSVSLIHQIMLRRCIKCVDIYLKTLTEIPEELNNRIK